MCIYFPVQRVMMRLGTGPDGTASTSTTLSHLTPRPFNPSPTRHIPHVMTLFDRRVDLAMFSEATPLYVMCREWMKNKPQRKRSRSVSAEEVSLERQTLTHSLSHSLSHLITHTLTLTHSLSHSLSHSHTHSLTHTLTYTLSPHIRSLSHLLAHIHSLSCSHSFTHSLTHSPYIHIHSQNL